MCADMRRKKASKPKSKSTAVASAQAQTEGEPAASASAAQERLRVQDTRTPAQRKFDEIKRIRVRVSQQKSDVID